MPREGRSCLASRRWRAVTVDAVEWSSLHLEGPDTWTYLNGQLTQDMTSVTASAWSALLEPDGRVITALVVRPTGSGADVIVPRSLMDEAHQRLRRFMLRIKCDLSFGTDVVEAPMNDDERWRTRFPGPSEFARGLLPHAFGDAFVARTVSFTKGCFTGQEIVGRMDARGASMPWRLVYASGSSAEAIDELLRSAGPAGPSGVTSYRELPSGVECLGIAHRSLQNSDAGAGAAIEFV